MTTFYKSRKFAYAAGTLLAAIVLLVLPSLVELDPATRTMLEEVLPLVFVLGFLVIGGHTATDMIATWREGVASKTLEQALHDMIDALTGQAPGTHVTVFAESTEPGHVAKVVSDAISRAQVPTWQNYQAYVSASKARGAEAMTYEDWRLSVTSPEAAGPRVPGDDAAP